MSSQSRVQGFLFPGRNSDCQGIIPRKTVYAGTANPWQIILAHLLVKASILQCFTCSEKFHSTQCSAGPAEPVRPCQNCHCPRGFSSGQLYSFTPQLRGEGNLHTLFTWLGLSLLSVTIYSFIGLLHTAKDVFPLPQTNFSMKKITRGSSFAVMKSNDGKIVSDLLQSAQETGRVPEITQCWKLHSTGQIKTTA